MSQERLTEIIYEKDLLYTKIDKLQEEIDWLDHERGCIEEQKKIDHNKAWIDKHGVGMDTITFLKSNQFKYNESITFIMKWIVANIDTEWVGFKNSVYRVYDIFEFVNSPTFGSELSQNGIIPRIINEILEDEQFE